MKRTESIVCGTKRDLVAIEGANMSEVEIKKVMDTATAAKVLKRNSKMVKQDAKDFCDAYDYAVTNLADMFLVESICNDYMSGKIKADKAMILIVQLVKNGTRG